jgi:hypothetical protein
MIVDLLRYARIEPEVLQVEIHPYLTQVRVPFGPQRDAAADRRAGAARRLCAPSRHRRHGVLFARPSVVHRAWRRPRRTVADGAQCRDEDLEGKVQVCVPRRNTAVMHSSADLGSSRSACAGYPPLVSYRRAACDERHRGTDCARCAIIGLRSAGSPSSRRATTTRASLRTSSAPVRICTCPCMSHRRLWPASVRPERR